MATLTGNELTFSTYSEEKHLQEDFAFNTASDAIRNAVHTSHKVVSIVKKFLGLLGKLILLVIISPFMLVLFWFAGYAYRRMYKKLLEKKEDIIASFASMEYDRLKKEELAITAFHGKIYASYKEVAYLKNNLLFRRLYKNMHSVVSLLDEYKRNVRSYYTYSSSDFSEEQLSKVSKFWSDYKAKSPEAYALIAEEDVESERRIFERKKAKRV